MIDKQEIISQVNMLPSMPTTVVQMGRILSDPETEIEDIVEVVQYDPGFTANVLKLANSAFLGFPRQVGSLKEAVIRIGTHKVYQIAVANTLKPLMNRDIKGYELASGEFWRHSIAVAVAAEEITRMTVKTGADSFTGGLLHDVGKLIVSNYLQENREKFEEKKKNIESFDAAEKELLGVDHAEVGATVLERWNIPEPLIDAVRFHHQPRKAKRNQVTVDQIHVGDAICLSAGIGIGSDELQYQIASDSVERLSLSSEDIQMVMSRTLEKMSDFEKLLTVAV